MVPIALEPVMQRLRTMGGNPIVRTSAAKMGPAISGVYLEVGVVIIKIIEIIIIVVVEVVVVVVVVVVVAS